MATALVTGGTGFVGSHVARTLIAAGHTVRILHRPSSPMTVIADLPVEHAIGDVTDDESLLAAMNGCHWVFHVAAVADYWRSDKARMYHINVDGSRMVFEAAERMGVKRVIFTSSGAAVGRPTNDQPADETIRFNLPPSQLPYGHSKFLAEAEAYRAVARGLDVVIVNPSVVLGPGDLNRTSGEIIVELKKGGVPAIPPGSATLIDVRDVAAAHLAAALVGRRGERYLLGAHNVNWHDLNVLAAEIVGVKPPPLVVPRPFVEPISLAVTGLRALKVPIKIDGNQVRLSGQNIIFDCRKAWRELGEPQIGLRQMLQDTYDWYVAQGVFEKY